MRFKLLCGFVALTFILAGVAGCKGGGPSAAIELVPQKANLVAQVQVSKLLSDPDLKNAYDRATKSPGQPQTVDEALNKLANETGFDFRGYAQALVFADVTTQKTDYVGVIIEGSFNEKQFIDAAQKKTGQEFVTSDYKGYRLYAGKDGKFEIAFLSDRLLLFGATKAVKDAIDVRKGDQKSISGIIIDMYNRLGNAPVRIAMQLPEDFRKSLTQNPAAGGVPISTQAFANIDALGIHFNKEAQTITLQVVTHFLNSSSAQDAKDTLSGSITLLKGVLQAPEAKQLLGNIEVTAADSWVTLALKTSVPEIEKLIEAFQPRKQSVPSQK